MSPRRRVVESPADDVEVADAATISWRDRSRAVLAGARGLPGLSVAACLVVIAAIVLGGLMLGSHETDRRAEVRNADVLGYVGQFMTQYTTLDPFHANDYADGILTHATGDFAKQFKDKQNEILVQVAQAEPTKGTVVDAGIERWHEDGSVSVLVATKISTTAGEPRKPVESGNRWVVMAVKEGQQWKISQLTQVI
jgi:Mce-associated membrane protein